MLLNAVEHSLEMWYLKVLLDFAFRGKSELSLEVKISCFLLSLFA